VPLSDASRPPGSAFPLPPLRNILASDSIQLVPLKGTYGYRVVSTQIVDLTDVQVLAHWLKKPSRNFRNSVSTCSICRSSGKTSHGRARRWLLQYRPLGATVYIVAGVSVMEPDLLLDVRGLQVEYSNGSKGVRGVQFRIYAGEVVGLLGESGRGKTSMALAIAQLLPLRAKRSGMVVLGCSQGRRPTIGFLFQEPDSTFHPFLTLGRQIREAARLCTPKEQVQSRVRGALDAVGLPAPEFACAFPHQLSGGQLQRAQLAQILVGDPAVIFADEPTAQPDRDFGSRALAISERQECVGFSAELQEDLADYFAESGCSVFSSV
jgi:ABC-type dipeptide/oligopeptide/nickel transport system ATPase subunit